MVLDSEGFVQRKELVQALQEEEGWSFLRMDHLEELLRSEEGLAFEVREDRIRATPQGKDPRPFFPEPAVPPKVLYYGARNRAYPFIMAHGLKPLQGPYVHLGLSEEMALRIGRRRDPRPVLITVHALKSHEQGIPYYRTHEWIYLTPFLPPEYLSGPPVPEGASKGKRKVSRDDSLPGSFFLDLERGIPMRGSFEREREKSKKETRRGYRFHGRR